MKSNFHLGLFAGISYNKCTSAGFRGTMDKLRIYGQGGQVLILAAKTASVFDDRENTLAFPEHSSGWCEAQVALFIPEK